MGTPLWFLFGGCKRSAKQKAGSRHVVGVSELERARVAAFRGEFHRVAARWLFIDEQSVVRAFRTYLQRPSQHQRCINALQLRDAWRDGKTITRTTQTASKREAASIGPVSPAVSARARCLDQPWPAGIPNALSLGWHVSVNRAETCTNVETDAESQNTTGVAE